MCDAPFNETFLHINAIKLTLDVDYVFLHINAMDVDYVFLHINAIKLTLDVDYV